MQSDYRILMSASEWNQLYNQLSSPGSERTQRINEYLSSLENTIHAREVNSGFAISSPQLDFSGIRNALRNRASHGRSSNAFVRRIPNCEYALVKSSVPAFELTELSELLLRSCNTNHYNNLDSSSLNVA